MTGPSPLAALLTGTRLLGSTPGAVLLTGALLVGTVPVAAQDHAPAGEIICEREAQCLRAMKGLADRQGNTLRLKLADGRWKTFRSNRKACDSQEIAQCVIRELRAYRPAQGVYVVEWTTAGDGGSEVVSAATGESVTLDTMPEFSPGGHSFVSVDPDELNDRQYDIAIWSVEGGTFAQELVYVRDTAAYEAWEFLGWDGEDRIRFRVTRPDKPPVETEARRTETGWRLKRP